MPIYQYHRQFQLNPSSCLSKPYYPSTYYSNNKWVIWVILYITSSLPNLCVNLCYLLSVDTLYIMVLQFYHLRRIWFKSHGLSESTNVLVQIYQLYLRWFIYQYLTLSFNLPNSYLYKPSSCHSIISTFGLSRWNYVSTSTCAFVMMSLSTQMIIFSNQWVSTSSLDHFINTNHV